MAGAQDERQPSGFDRDLVGLRDHPGVSDDGDVGELVGGLEGVDDRQHGGGLGLVALESLHGQREPGGVGQQPEGDLRFQAALLGETGFAESVAGVGFEVQRRDVEKHQRRRPQPGASCTGGGQGLAPLRAGIAGQAPLDGGIGRGFDADLGQYPSGVDLAGGFDDPGEHQIAKHSVALGGRLESQDPVRSAQRVPQVRHPGGGDGQRLRARRCGHIEIEHSLVSRQPLGRGSLQRSQLGLIMGRAQMFNRARPAPRRPHDLHRGRPRGGLHGAHIGHPGSLRTRFSAQILSRPTKKPQVKTARPKSIRNREPSQVTVTVTGVKGGDVDFNITVDDHPS